MLLLIISVLSFTIFLLFSYLAYKKNKQLLSQFLMIPIIFSLTFMIALPSCSYLNSRSYTYLVNRRSELINKLEAENFSLADAKTIYQEVEEFNNVITTHRNNFDNKWIGMIFYEDVAQIEKIDIGNHIVTNSEQDDSVNICIQCDTLLLDSFNFCPSCGLKR